MLPGIGGDGHDGERDGGHPDHLKGAAFLAVGVPPPDQEHDDAGGDRGGDQQAAGGEQDQHHRRGFRRGPVSARPGVDDERRHERGSADRRRGQDGSGRPAAQGPVGEGKQQHRGGQQGAGSHSQLATHSGTAAASGRSAGPISWARRFSGCGNPAVTSATSAAIITMTRRTWMTPMTTSTRPAVLPDCRSRTSRPIQSSTIPDGPF